ncbi:MAG: hypothetical protein JW969_11390 [Spirochaetales bacterium]|nr:hypothetical protein [Spirochaetales bacterium]
MVLLDLSLTDPKIITDADENDGKVVCVRCKTSISDKKYMITVTGDSPFHTFTNPHGFSFNIITFGYCENVMEVSEPVGEYSWFPGYLWSILACRECHEHLGWRFSGDVGEVNQFFGLIREKLIFPLGE